MGFNGLLIRLATADYVKLTGPPISCISHAYSPLINDNLTSALLLTSMIQTPPLFSCPLPPSLIRRRILTIVLRYFLQYGGDLYDEGPELRPQES
jgi:hypothetical protein